MSIQNRKDHINYLKAFAAVLVVTHHAFTQSGIHSSGVVLQAIYLLITNVHVPLFFCIAGYLCHKQAFGAFYKKKIQRILIPFLFFSFLKLVYTNLVDDAYRHAATLPLQLFDAYIMGALYWFAYAILLMYAVSPILWKLKKGNIIVFCVLIVVNIFLEAADKDLTNILQIRKTVSHACFFVGGFLLQQYESFFTNAQKRKPLIFTISLLLTGGILFLNLTEMPKLPYLLKILFSFSQMYLLYSLASVLPKNISILNCIGRHSLQVMFFDSFFKAVLFALLPTTSPLLVFLLVAVNIALTCLAVFIIEKIPYVRNLFGL